jgi:lysozyme family protein
MPKAPTYRTMWPLYAERWDAAEHTRRNSAMAVAKRLVAAKPRYINIQHVTGVPWYWIGPVHVRESSQDWSRSLAQGDRWDRASVHVPAGRGPFASFEAAAIDALQLNAMTRVTDWRLEKLIYYWEKFNGWGYWWYHRATPSPYVWGSTTVQKPGKYVADGVWSSSVTDVQLGCVAMLKAIMELDPLVKPQRED